MKTLKIICKVSILLAFNISLLHFVIKPSKIGYYFMGVSIMLYFLYIILKIFKIIKY